MESSSLVNVKIPNQLPQLYKQYGPNFVAFIKAYYEWLEQTGNPLYYSRNFANLVDVDNTMIGFLSHFKNEYMNALPANVVANQQLLIKHIINLYSAKGSKKGIELLFRILFDEDIQLYLPSQHIFKLSDNTWVKLNYLEVTDSPYLQSLVGNYITSGDFIASALVEDYTVISINNKVTNVLLISNLNGNFPYGSIIISPDVPQINSKNAPICVGSLSSVSIENGGIFFNVGDIVNIQGITGTGGLGRVASIQNQNGKTIFNLINGGFGFTMNPQIQVTGGNGSGATFSIGSLSNQSLYVVNTDSIDDYINTQLDIPSEGFNINISSTVGTFQVGEYVNCSTNGLIFDFKYLQGSLLSNGEILSNTSLGIDGLQVVLQDPNLVTVVGTDTNLNNANIVGGTILVGSVSDDIIEINSVIPKITYNGSGIIETVNSTVMTINNSNNYFIPTGNLIGNTSHAHCVITNVVRNTNWDFPIAPLSNLDSEIENILDFETLVIGSISSLIKENPGNNYSSNATVVVNEPAIAELAIPDGMGGIWGLDANIQAVALNGIGVMTVVQVIDSGYGFSPNEPVDLFSNNQFTASGVAVVDGAGIAQGYWNSNKSFLSDEMYLQDSYYYQNFSYEILAPRMLSTYKTFMENVMHPVGYALFGTAKFIDQQTVNTQVDYSSSIQYNANGTVIVSET